jgi:hypothetical protein
MVSVHTASGMITGMMGGFNGERHGWPQQEVLGMPDRIGRAY